jgi:hypothetical protein
VTKTELKNVSYFLRDLSLNSEAKIFELQSDSKFCFVSIANSSQEFLEWKFKNLASSRLFHKDVLPNSFCLNEIGPVVAAV